jgi:hypothetical protein
MALYQPKAGLMQEDFDSLALSNCQVSCERIPDADHVQPTFQVKASSSIGDKNMPVNSISDSVVAMINAWQASHTFKQDALDSAMSVKPTSSADLDIRQEDMYEPVRITTEIVPPKKFFRTFWRSAARRLVQREKQLAIRMITCPAP